MKRLAHAWRELGAFARQQASGARAMARSFGTAARPTTSSFSGRPSLRWLSVFGSSLLVASVARRHAVDEVHAEARESGVSEWVVDEAVYNPPAPPHDSWTPDWDGLASVPVSIDAATGRPLHVTRHLLFIRHGQYVLPKPETEHLDPVLTSLGREQARITGARLAALGYPISVIHCSTMARAFETATLIRESFPTVPLLPTDLLREGVPCAHVPQHPAWFPSDEDKAVEPPRIKAAFDAIVKRWRQTPDGTQIHDKEEWARSLLSTDDNGVIPRATDSAPIASSTAAISTLASSSAGTIALSSAGAGSSSSRLPPLHVDRYELVVCHGNVIRYSLLRALQLPVQAWLRLAIYNTGITHIYVRANGHVGIQTMGDTGHLTKEQITYH